MFLLKVKLVAVGRLLESVGLEIITMDQNPPHCSRLCFINSIVSSKKLRPTEGKLPYLVVRYLL